MIQFATPDSYGINWLWLAVTTLFCIYVFSLYMKPENGFRHCRNVFSSLFPALISLLILAEESRDGFGGYGYQRW
jgi:hypothetical protein